MHLSSLLERIAIFALSAPIIVMIATKLGWYKNFIALFAYYILGLAFMLMSIGVINLSSPIGSYFGILTNLLDAPLTLFFLAYMARSTAFKQKIYWLIGAFALYEAVILSFYGYTVEASTIITIPGLVLTMGLALIFAIHQIKITVVYHKAAGKAIFASTLFFTYVGFTYVYYVFYFMNNSFQDDARLVFFALSIVSALVMSVGLLFERKRVAKLFEIKTTREELKALYVDEQIKTTASLEAIVFNMENHWKRESAKSVIGKQHGNLEASESMYD
ncbi:hypothetical protein LZZ85_02615 [Terrimonas sp. NA20]|uniref:GGDEF domain-containing protein n=1 Tax=Terrimonas ginsenosidimutans TaxID=2908004 RepID=A0ABS9KLE3_9BACT|nr:hypothetical protein [Terrimonas ginsenosidimutans]MCG2613148.1 hypothetical protein [Terrimonas ginsenosidimutans]